MTKTATLHLLLGLGLAALGTAMPSFFAEHAAPEYLVIADAGGTLIGLILVALGLLLCAHRADRRG